MVHTRVVCTSVIGVGLVIYSYLLFLQPILSSVTAKEGIVVVKKNNLQTIETLRSATDNRKVRRPNISQTTFAQINNDTLSESWERQNLRLGIVLDSSVLSEQITTQSRDEEWAHHTEWSIKEALTPITNISEKNLSIRCKFTLCEVRGYVTDNLSTEIEVNVMDALQGRDLQKKLFKAGLRPITTSFDSVDGSRSFLIYAARQ